MKKLLMLVLLILSACAKQEDQTQSSGYDDIHYALPVAFVFSLNGKPIRIEANLDSVQSNIEYDSSLCPVETLLVDYSEKDNYRLTNYYYLEISSSETAASECSELAGGYWFHYNGLGSNNVDQLKKVK